MGVTSGYARARRAELAKQWDLRKLSIYLIQWLTQAAIDLLYPEQEEADPDAVLEDEGEESDAEE